MEVDDKKGESAGGKLAPQAFNKLRAKSVLSLSQRVRELEGAQLDTFVIAADSKVATRVTSAGAKYAHAVRAEGAQHEYGPPHPWKFEALMAALVEDYDKSTVGEKIHGELASALTPYEELDTEDRCDIVRTLKLEKMYEKSKKRLVVCVDNSNATIRKPLIAALVTTGAQRKVGKAPPGAMERAMQSHLESGGKGSGKKK